MVKNLIKTHHHLNKVKLKIKVVPVCINYDRVFDVNWFAEETMNGKLKPGTTLINVMGKMMNMNKGKIGKVFVKYADPIDLENYISEFKA